jgi:Rieske Fe-S protein
MKALAAEGGFERSARTLSSHPDVVGGSAREGHPRWLPFLTMVGRRAFVKGCLGASAAGLLAAGAGGLASPLLVGGGSVTRRVDYLGATVVGGPAPQGLPLVPLRADGDGRLSIEPSPDGIPGGVLDWYRYCGHAAAPGLRAGFQPADEQLRYTLALDRVDTVRALQTESGRDDVGWQLPRLGEVARVADFQAAGHGAGTRWRPGAPGPPLHVLVLRVRGGALVFEDGAEEELVRAQVLVPAGDGDVLVAYFNLCKHLCCVAGWHESRKAVQEGLFETLYCTCHYSAYDPLRIRGDFFMLQERRA